MYGKSRQNQRQLKVEAKPFPNVLQIGAPKNFAIFTGKHISWSLFLIKLQNSRPVTSLKRDSNTGVLLFSCFPI